MNPIKIFLSIFAAGIALTIALSAVGYQQDLTGEEVEQVEPGETADTLNVPSYMQSCLGCHGTDLRGGGAAPGIRNLAHLTKDQIVDILVNGQGQGMPGGLIPGKEVDAAEYLLSIEDK
jgi:mono/diheme cytochrome c family protein